jgi:adenine-specific DNA-methyltransferase
LEIEFEIINYNMDGTSLTPQEEKLKALQQLLPEAFAEGKID